MSTFGHVLQLKDKFSGTMNKWNQSATNFKSTQEDLVKANVAVAASFGAMAVAGTIALAKMATAFASVEQRAKELRVVTTTTFQNIDQAMAMSLERARQFSNQFVFSMEEIVGSSFELASAGLNVEETVAGIEQAAFLASAGLGDLRETAILMGSAFNTLGKAAELQFMDPMEKAKKIADSTALAVKKFQITLPVLQEGLKYTVGPASQLGVSIDELNSTLGMLNTLGLRASVAGTVLSNVFAKMSGAVDKLGLDTTKFLDSAGNLTSIADYMEEVKKALPSNSFERFSKLIEVFGIRAARGVVALLDNVEALRQNTKELNNSEGAAERFGQTIASSVQSRVKILANNFENLKVLLGAKFAPAIKVVVNAFASLFGGIQKLVSGPLGRFIVALTIVVSTLSAFIAIAAAAKLILTVLASKHIVAGLAAIKHALGIAAIQAAYGNFAAVAAVVGVIALATAVTFALIGEEAQSAAESIDYANTRFEGVSSTLGRVRSDAAKLNRVIEGGFDFRIGKQEVVAFADLIDFKDKRRLFEEVQKLEAVDARINANIDYAIDPSGVSGLGETIRGFKDTGDELMVGVLGVMDDATRQMGDLLSFPFLQGADAAGTFQKAVDPMEERLRGLKAEMDVTQIEEGTAEFLRLQAAVLRLDKEGLGRLQLRAFALQMAQAEGATVKAAEIFDQVVVKLRAMGLGLEKVGVFLGVFASEREKAFKSTGITLGIKEVENFRSNVEASRKDLEKLARLADRKAGASALEIPKNMEGKIRAQYDFITANLSEIGKFDPQFAQNFKRQLAAVDGEVQTASGTFAGLNRIVESTSDGLEDQGKFESARNRTARNTSAVFAQQALTLDRMFGQALKAATEKADQLSGALTLKSLINTEMIAPIGQFAERIKQVKANAKSLGKAFDPRTLAEQDSLLKGQVKRLAEARGEQAKLVRILEDKLKRVGDDVQARARINKELGESLRLQTSLAEQSSETARQAEQVRNRFIATSQARFPDLAREMGIEKGKAFKLSFEIESEVRDRFEEQIKGVEDRLKEIRAQDLEIQARLTGSPGAVVREALETTRRQLQVQSKGLQVKIEDLRAKAQLEIDERSLQAADRRIQEAAERMRQAGKIPVTILESKAEFEFLTRAIEESLSAGLQTGKFEDFTAALSQRMRKELISGIVGGLTEGFVIGFAAGDLKAVGQRIGEALREGGAEGGKKIEAELRQLEANVGRLNFSNIGGAEGAQAAEVFQRMQAVIGQIDESFTSASRGALNFKAVADTAASGLNKDLASLTTRLQMATGAEREFIRQIIALKEGRGAVAGIALAGADAQEQLRAALSLMRQMKDARVSGAPLQDLTKVIDSLNLKLREGRALGGVAPMIEPAVSLEPVNRLKAAFAELEGRTVSVDVKVLGKNDLEDAIDLLNSEITLADQIEQANTRIQELRVQAQQVVDILGSARIGVGGRIEVGASAAPDQVAINTGATTFTIHAAGGITEGQRDEILRRVAQDMDDKIEEIRGQLDALILPTV